MSQSSNLLKKRKRTPDTGTYTKGKLSNNELCRIIMLLADKDKYFYSKISGEPKESTDFIWDEFKANFDDEDYELDETILNQKKHNRVNIREFGHRSASKLKVRRYILMIKVYLFL